MVSFWAVTDDVNCMLCETDELENVNGLVQIIKVF